MKKLISIAVISSLLAALMALSGCGKAEAKATKSRIIRVDTQKLTEKIFRQKIGIQGTVQPVEEADISSRTSGTLDIVHVIEGEIVKKGQALFQVDRQNLENIVTVNKHNLEVEKDSLATAEIDLKVAGTVYRKEQIDFNRAKRLRDSHAISEDAYETADVNLQTAAAEIEKCASVVNYSKSKVEQQKVNLRIAEKNLEDSLVLAPFDGVITAKKREQGEYVNSGTPIVHIENQNALELSCLISGIYYDSIIPEKTKVVLALDHENAGDAVISYRSPSVEPQSRTFEIKIRLPEGTPLISGTLCDVSLILTERSGRGLPTDAVLLRKGGKYKAFTSKDGKAELVDVTPGITEEGMTEISDSDKLLNEQFIVSGQYFVNPGDAVISNTKTPALE
ncbi:MAG: hypothetical protein A2020_06605 [Lentisphaerae bacterium GWF2_45_14]|nr:MAG: hypothetical protein A2020_06605 [Lentisphaerae bacterium GWF2_45_14]